MSAALWCDDLGMRALLIEKSGGFGGQLSHIFNPVNNYLGLSGSNGEAIVEEFERSLIGREFTRMVGVEVTDLDPERMTVAAADRKEYSARALIVSTGVRRRRLGVSGEKEFEGKGILSSGTKDPAIVAGRHVVVVGGGDAAAENALILAQYASRVTLVHRRGKLTARSEFLKRLELAQNIDLSFDSVVETITGADRLRSVEIRNVATGKFKRWRQISLSSASASSQTVNWSKVRSNSTTVDISWWIASVEQTFQASSLSATLLTRPRPRSQLRPAWERRR